MAATARILLAYLIALPAIAPMVARSIANEQPYTLVLRLASTVGGQLQIFYDTGYGYGETQSSLLPLNGSGIFRDYSVRLPPGRYHGLRIDPGSGGAYVIEKFAILAADGSTVHAASMTALVAAQQLEVRERSVDRLVLEASPGSNDPIVTYAPATPITLPPVRAAVARLLLSAAPYWIAAGLLVWSLGRVARRAASTALRCLLTINRFGASNPNPAILVAALVAAVVSTYPVLFLGRSFVSPNNGGAYMLYDELPFVSGSADFAIEDTRGSDVGVTMWQSIPHAGIQRKAIAAGEFPLWNRYNAAGRPLWGQGLTYLLDPLHWLTLVGRDPAAGWDLKYVAHRFVFATGVGMAAFAMTGAWLPSAIVATIAPFTGIHAYRFSHPAIFTLTYAPWALLGWFQLARARLRRQRAAAACLIALALSLVLLASTPKEAALTSFAIQLAGAIAVLTSPGTWREAFTRLAFAVAAGVIMALITMPHWLVFFDTLGASSTNYDIPVVVFATTPHFIGLFLSPIVPGVPLPGLTLLALTLTFGVVLSPVRALRTPPALGCFAASVVILSVGFGLVPEAWLLRIPLLRNIVHLDDACISAVVPLVLIACAAGAQAVLSRGAFFAWMVGAATGVAGVALVAKMATSAPTQPFEPWAALLLLPAATLIPTCAWLMRRGAAPMAGAVATLAAGAALLLPGGQQVETGSDALDRMLAQPRFRTRLADPSPAVAAIHRAMTEPARVTGLETTLFPGTQGLYDLEGIGGADPLEVPEYRALIDAADVRRQWYWLTVVGAADLPRLNPLLDLLNVEFIVARSEGVPGGVERLPMTSGDRLRALRRPTAWPRAFFVDTVSTYDAPVDLLQRVAAVKQPLAGIDAHDEVAIAATKSVAGGSGTFVRAHEYWLTPNTTTFHLRTQGPGVAVLTETHLPHDFRVTLNGAPAEYFRVNHAFKGVVIPAAGDWRVRFEYRPARWTLALRGAAIGLMGFAGLGVLAIGPGFTGRFGRRSPDESTTARAGASSG